MPESGFRALARDLVQRSTGCFVFFFESPRGRSPRRTIEDITLKLALDEYEKYGVTKIPDYRLTMQKKLLST
jgi:hypothetical protein